MNSQPEKRPTQDGVEASSSVDSFEIDAYESEEEAASASEESSDDDSGRFSCDDLANSLSSWAVRFGVSLVALTALLSILKSTSPLPSKRWTLFAQDSKSVCGGKVSRWFFLLFRNIELSW